MRLATTFIFGAPLWDKCALESSNNVKRKKTKPYFKMYEKQLTKSLKCFYFQDICDILDTSTCNICANQRKIHWNNDTMANFGYNLQAVTLHH